MSFSDVGGCLLPAAKPTSRHSKAVSFQYVFKGEKKSKIANTGMESKVILCTRGRSDLAFEDFLPCPMTATGLVGPNLVAAVVAVFAVSIESTANHCDDDDNERTNERR